MAIHKLDPSLILHHLQQPQSTYTAIDATLREILPTLRAGEQLGRGAG